MAGGEDKTVTVDPSGIGGINLERVAIENSTDIGGTERKTKVARLAGGDGIEGKSAGIAGCEFKDLFVHKIDSPEQTERPTLASLQEALFCLIEPQAAGCCWVRQ